MLLEAGQLAKLPSCAAGCPTSPSCGLRFGAPSDGKRMQEPPFILAAKPDGFRPLAIGGLAWSIGAKRIAAPFFGCMS